MENLFYFSLKPGLNTHFSIVRVSALSFFHDAELTMDRILEKYSSFLDLSWISFHSFLGN
jgi:hypothetical protein